MLLFLHSSFIGFYTMTAITTKTSTTPSTLAELITLVQETNFETSSFQENLRQPTHFTVPHTVNESSIHGLRAQDRKSGLMLRTIRYPAPLGTVLMNSVPQMDSERSLIEAVQVCFQSFKSPLMAKFRRGVLIELTLGGSLVRFQGDKYLQSNRKEAGDLLLVVRQLFLGLETAG